jgi:hypothetical protein
MNITIYGWTTRAPKLMAVSTHPRLTQRCFFNTLTDNANICETNASRSNS